MRKLLAIGSSIWFAALATSAFADQQGPVEIPAPVSKIYIPMGFDDNDNAEVVLKGEFPTSCYNIGRTGAEVDQQKMEITVWATSYMYLGGENCAQVTKSFIQPIKVGVLKKGDYKVIFKFNKEVQSAMNVVERTTESPDNFLYAPVENAKINVDNNGKQSLVISGHYPYMFVGCMVIREVRTERSPADVLVVQPITEIVQGDECNTQPGDKAYEITQGVAQPFMEEGLLHVRVLNGDSLNRFIPKPQM